MRAEAAGSLAFRLGVNYWPARTAMGWWTGFDPGEVRRDFARIASTGMDSVRVFLLWEQFQPEPDRIDRTMLARLVEVADAAQEAGLSLMPTLFTGHMSGVNWIPTWALGGERRDERFRVVSRGRVVAEGLRDWYADPDMARAQALLAREAATALAGHASLMAWDLGNENSNCVVPATHDDGRRWLGRIAGAIRGADPATEVTIGLHMEDLEQDRRIGPSEAAEVCDFLTMHGYPIYASWAEGATDEHLVPFLARVTRWLGGGAQVLFSEFGLPTARAGGSDDHDPDAPVLAGGAEAARYTRQVLEGLRLAGCTGAMVWCYADYAPERWAVPPLDEATHERSFGLWRSDGTAKPAVAEVSAFAGSPRSGPGAGDRPEDFIDTDPGAYWLDPPAELTRLYRRYREMRSSST
ncbi:MAG TPA: cellulase family glycosylhydrolase [Actinomycetota bacterium]